MTTATAPKPVSFTSRDLARTAKWAAKGQGRLIDWAIRIHDGDQIALLVTVADRKSGQARTINVAI